MRLWSIHPKYLDSKGLVACWREGLLAQKVLKGETKGYTNHPQLERFKNKPLVYIAWYLHEICNEAEKRGYHFTREKICVPYTSEWVDGLEYMKVSNHQLKYEFEHLQLKLSDRNSEKGGENLCLSKYGMNIQAHPIFNITNGDIEEWEKIK